MLVNAVLVHVNGVRTVLSDGDRITAGGETISIRDAESGAVTKFPARNMPKQQQSPTWPHQ